MLNEQNREEPIEITLYFGRTMLNEQNREESIEITLYFGCFESISERDGEC